CGFSDNCKQILSTSASSMKGSSVVKFMSSSPFKMLCASSPRSLLFKKGIMFSILIFCLRNQYLSNTTSVLWGVRTRFDALFPTFRTNVAQNFSLLLSFCTSQKPSFLVG